MPQTSHCLGVHDLVVRRGDETLIDGLSWQHASGKVAWVTGPNGVGKSTLLRVLAGIDRPAAGSVTYTANGQRVASIAGMLGYYSPSMGLPAESRASAFVTLMHELAGDFPFRPDRSLASKRCRSLSTGEEKRLLLGPMLARRRPFIVLDEPYEHLSRDARLLLDAELATLARTSVVIVSTNQPVPEELSGPTIALSIREAPLVA